jgi:hypothetical protein
MITLVHFNLINPIMVGGDKFSDALHRADYSRVVTNRYVMLVWECRWPRKRPTTSSSTQK